MVDVGTQENTVQTQKVIITNETDSKTYIQATIVNFTIDSNVTKHQLNDDTIDNSFSLPMNSIEGTLRITIPEWADLVTLTKDVNGIRPIKSWSVKWTDDSGNTATTTFDGQLKTLISTDDGLQKLRVNFRIEATEKVVVT